MGVGGLEGMYLMDVFTIEVCVSDTYTMEICNIPMGLKYGCEYVIYLWV